MSLPTEKLYTWQRGTDVPFKTRVSMGKVVDARPVFVFGFNPDVQNVKRQSGITAACTPTLPRPSR
jgi:hypothetical protein